MDAEKEVFDLVHSSDDTIFSLAQQPNDLTSLYFGEGRGGFNIWDIRTGKSSKSLILHEDRINTIDFNSQNPNIMATSSTDGTACIWDLRRMNASKPKTLKTVSHSRAVHAAYFSPSGNSIATTGYEHLCEPKLVLLIFQGMYIDIKSSFYFCVSSFSTSHKE